MNELASVSSVTEAAEIIPGYVLEEKIGTGGCGEVWKATAPGGLLKAVKIIHGHADDKRAARELRSLNRAKLLSHPFLLSLERIEVVDGHLVIITELADATLRDRFDDCQQRGLSGIPRDELLEYVREAADALDYLFDNHSLQHLDVKPDNFLLFGKHVKVADFGLLKDLQDNRASMVSGLTPMYASPEMFEGRPGRHSDQYSLAVLYQELATGKLPFCGSNIAALASQHLHNAPELISLTPLERFAVGKALSKDPEHRFPNCRAFADRLGRRSAVVSVPEQENVQRTGRSVSSFDRSDGPNGHIHDGQTIEVSAPEIFSLPKLDLVNKTAYRPTVFIGIGGTGGMILCHLKQILSDRFGEPDELPALQLLYVDTDITAINAACTGVCGCNLVEDQTLLTPLRQTQEYRQRPVSNLDSISRRWIYNTPRSMKTEGFRALGRLSLLDNSERILDSIRKSILTCVSSDAIALSTRNSGLPFQEEDPRVFIVSSVSGGTGGGMAIDLAYATRQVLAECGYADDEICALFSFSTSGCSKASGISSANTYAFCEELNYFSQAGSDYPGESTCGLAGFVGDGPTFKSTYLVDLGENMSSDAYSEATDQLANYLALNTVSSAHRFFDGARTSNRVHAGSRTPFRSVGLSPFGAGHRGDPTPWVELLCKCVVRKWQGGREAVGTYERIKLSEQERILAAQVVDDSIEEGVASLFEESIRQYELSIDGLVQRIREFVSEQLKSSTTEYLRTIVDDTLEKAIQGNDDESPAQVALRTIKTIVGPTSLFSTGDRQVESLSDILLPHVKQIGADRGLSLSDWLLCLINRENTSIDSARQVAARISDHLEQLKADACQRLEESKEKCDEANLRATCIAREPKSRRRSYRRTVRDVVLDYGETMVDRLVWEGTCRMFASLEPHVTSAADQLREFWTDLNRLADEFTPSNHVLTESAENIKDSPADSRISFCTIFRQHQMELVEQLDRESLTSVLATDQSLRHVLTEGNLRQTVETSMRMIGRKLLLQAMSKATQEYLKRTLSSGASAPDFANIIEQGRQGAIPKLLSLGGDKRLLLVVPKELDPTPIAKEILKASGEQINIVEDSYTGFAFCYEVESIPLQGIFNRLIRQRHDCQELANRLHTRINTNFTVG